MDASSPGKSAWSGGGGFFALLVITGIVLFVLAVAIGTVTETDVAAWLEALSTFAAFVAAGVAVHYAFQTWTLEHRREQDRLDADRRAQAALVAGWVLSPIAEEDDKSLLPRYKPLAWKLHLRNASEIPIYGLRVEYLAHLAGVRSQRAQFDKVDLGGQHVGTVPPGVLPPFTPEDHIREALSAELADRHLVLPPRITVLVRFRDADERRWVRDHSGRLQVDA